MKGPFIATAQIDGPFKIQSEPYIIMSTVPTAIGRGSALRRVIGLTVVILAIVIAYVIARLARTKQT